MDIVSVKIDVLTYYCSLLRSEFLIEVKLHAKQGREGFQIKKQQRWPGLVAHIFNFCTWEAEAGLSEFKVSSGYIVIPCFEKLMKHNLNKASVVIRIPLSLNQAVSIAEWMFTS